MEENMKKFTDKIETEINDLRVQSKLDKNVGKMLIKMNKTPIKRSNTNIIDSLN